MEVRKKKHVGRIIFNIFYWIVFALIGVVVINRIVDQNNQYRYPLFGYRLTVIISPSMASVDPANEPYITNEMQRVYVNDAITTKEYTSYSEIQLYDIATYYKNGVLICHRVIDKYEDSTGKYLIFRGDANAASDDPVKYDQVRGKVVNIDHNIGQFILFVQSTWGKVTIFGALGIIYISSLFVHSKEER